MGQRILKTQSRVYKPQIHKAVRLLNINQYLRQTCGQFLNIGMKSMHQLLSNLRHKQTGRQTDGQTTVLT